jgi:Na+/proline symporter
MVIRSLGDSVRVFATAIPLAVVTGWSIPVSVLVVVLVTLVYTLRGGLAAVVWVDVLQLGLYILGGLLVIMAAAPLAGGLPAAVDRAWDAGKLATFDFQLSFRAPYTFVAAVLGGALLSAASHGTDHLIVQRLLGTRSLRDARRALIGSGFLVITQFALFLFVGTMLWAAGADTAGVPGDRLYPEFVVQALRPGLTGLVIAGLLAAAMSTVSSSLNALASAATHDFYAPLTGKRDPQHLLRVGRWFTAGWCVVLGGGALLFRSNDQPVVELALSIASITYGSLLGAYMLGGVARMRQREVLTGIVVSVISMLVVVLGKPAPVATLAWPWYVPLGLTLTLLAAFATSLLPRRS